MVMPSAKITGGVVLGCLSRGMTIVSMGRTMRGVRLRTSVIRDSEMYWWL